MSMTVARIVAEEAAHRELPMPPWAYGVIALLAFAFLLGVTWSFRGTAQKYAAPGHGTAHGTGPGPAEGSAPATDDDPHWPEHPRHGAH